MTHRQKLRLARKHRTIGEIRDHIAPFQSAWWIRRAELIKFRAEESRMRKNDKS